MKREIKFRIIHNNKIAGYEFLTETGWKWNWIELNPDKGERWSTGVIQDSTPKAMIRNQFTGLLDKNGKEIYEGDVLQSSYYGCPAHYVIEWWEGSASWFPKTLHDLHCTYGTTWKDFIIKDEVIGNIYENPELLKPQTA